jgi:hypothetical protein
VHDCLLSYLYVAMVQLADVLFYCYGGDGQMHFKYLFDKEKLRSTISWEGDLDLTMFLLTMTI